ncbi:hypothetical protein ALC56_06895 [Trachymyrmex septentrionalis]|uniref:Uncharacterized protein n=1 Tax=Trachymyrmex septentrionalis TaxID=34720 RepID=A0A195FEV5_9HYME|nr:hypothetical protein ALC56_06895 [Trachymyrmex septentrionalis]
MCTVDAISAMREEGLSSIAAAVHQWIPTESRNGRRRIVRPAIEAKVNSTRHVASPAACGRTAMRKYAQFRKCRWCRYPLTWKSKIGNSVHV